MNDLTPDRLKGSLLERAAAAYHFAPRSLPQGIVIDPPRPPRIEVPPPAPAAHRAVRADKPAVPIDRTRFAEAGMIVPGAPVTRIAEEFRLVKRQLLTTARTIGEADVTRACTVLVCSANPNDGKTFCAVNLALSLAAERDIEVLLVDADFAKPDVLNRLGVPAGPGFLDALSDPAIDVEDLVIRTDVPQLSLLGAGTASHGDTELLSSAHARAVVARLVAAHPSRIVLFDSPPALAASAGSELAALVGQVMLVVRADRTGEADLRAAVGLLDRCEHINLVLNSVTFRPGSRQFGTYYHQEATA